MTTVGMDTHEVVKELLAAGFSQDQAEAVTRLVYKARDVDLSNLATKADLAATKAELLATLQVSLAETKADILKWMVGTVGVQTVVILGAVVTIVRLLPK